MAERAERFSPIEMTALRSELMKGLVDSRTTAELLQMFLMGHGYGVSPESAIEAATRVGGAGCTLVKSFRGEGMAAHISADNGLASSSLMQRNPIFAARTYGDCASGSTNI